MLSNIKKIFCKEYIVDFNGAAAAERAGYSKKRARITASELLSDKAVAIEVSNLIKERTLKTELSADWVVNELKTIASAKTTDFIKVKDIFLGTGKKRHKVRIAYVELTSDTDEEKQKAISEISQTKDGIRLKTHDKVKALELLGRHLGIFEKDNKQSRPVVFSKKITFK